MNFPEIRTCSFHIATFWGEKPCEVALNLTSIMSTYKVGKKTNLTNKISFPDVVSIILDDITSSLSCVVKWTFLSPTGKGFGKKYGVHMDRKFGTPIYINSGKRPGSIGTKWSHCQQKTTSMVKWWSNVCWKKRPVEMANKQVIEMPQSEEKDVSANDCFQVQISKWSNLDKEERIHYADYGWYLYFWSLKTQILQGNLLGKIWQKTYIGTS